MVRELLLAAATGIASLAAVPLVPPTGPPVRAAVPPVPPTGPPARAVPAPARGWGWPLEPEPAVEAAFHAPPTPWGAGHRGVDRAAAVGQPALTAGGGRLTFARRVAGRGVLVVTHPGGWRTSYEPVERRAAVGTAVRRGDPVGVVGPEASHCAPRTCLHWGARHGASYVDPLTLVGQGPPVLLPVG
jgi:murein DD-endopeptidase MepM/ murein hydrolase activator NlpD